MGGLLGLGGAGEVPNFFYGRGDLSESKRHLTAHQIGQAQSTRGCPFLCFSPAGTPHERSHDCVNGSAHGSVQSSGHRVHAKGVVYMSKKGPIWQFFVPSLLAFRDRILKNSQIVPFLPWAGCRKPL